MLGNTCWRYLTLYVPTSDFRFWFTNLLLRGNRTTFHRRHLSLGLMAWGGRMALGQPLDIGSQAMLNSRLPICAKTFIGAVFVVNLLAF